MAFVAWRRAGARPRVTMLLHQIVIGPNMVGEALALAETIADPARPGTAARVAVVVEELVMNLLDHTQIDRSATLSIGFEPVATGVRVVLIDDAAPFDPRAARPIGDLPNEERGGGGGLELVRAWSRIVRYTRIAGRNELELIVHVDPEDV